MPATAVSSAAATGATSAAMGTRVGSDPVSSTGNAMLRIVATPQTVTVAAASPIQMGLRAASPRSLPIAQTNAAVATSPPQPAAEGCHWEMLLAARDQIRSEQADQRHRNPDAGDPGHGPQHPRAVGHGRTPAGPWSLHLCHRRLPWRHDGRHPARQIRRVRLRPRRHPEGSRRALPPRPAGTWRSPRRPRRGRS